THTINHSSCGDVVAEVRKISKHGTQFSVETSALPAVLQQAVQVLMPLGTCVLLGSARGGTQASFEMPFLQNGRAGRGGSQGWTVRGVIQGWSQPEVFLPRLVDLMMEGKLPVERMMTDYELADINRAAADAAAGRTIKPVLRMPQ